MPTPRICVLDNDTINKIAAGEVIERPSSVVKELVENAIDANADMIEVRLGDGGRQLIEVADNGAGMDPEGLVLAVQRHATSKLRSVDDLDSITTLGFRGEALPSIASVSRCTITSRPHEAAEGCRIVIAGAEVQRVPIGCPPGTIVRCEELFYNTPARKKFLRTGITERGHVVDMVQRIAIGMRGGSFAVREGERTLLDVPALTDQRQRMLAALGQSVKGLFLLPAVERGPYQLEGFFAAPHEARRDARGIYLYVNGRMVRDRLMQGAVREGFRSLLPHDRQPIVIVYLTAASGSVDVNVHPQKTEVRFTQPQEVFRLVSTALAAALAHAPWLKAGPVRSYSISPPAGNGQGSFPAISLAPRAGERRDQEPIPDQMRFLFETAASPEANVFFRSLRYHGQLHDTYLLCESPRGELVLIDQHAAHERVRMQQLVTAFENRQPPAVQLLIPVTLDLPPAEYEGLIALHDELAGIGIDLEPFSGTTVVVNSLPAGVRGDPAAVASFLRDVTQSAAEESETRPIKDRRDRLLASCACHGAVKAGDPLSTPEAEALLTQLDEARAAPFCPHGRSFVHVIGLEQIERWVNRR